MCGVAGIISRNQSLNAQLAKAEFVQRHRGPDQQQIAQYKVGAWTIGLGHQRLPIIDLSEDGNQPMVSRDGTKFIVYNGEIYNYKEIRSELDMLGWGFHTASDTEVLLTALVHWGIEEAQPRFNGMWAYAYLDSQNRSLTLSRDRAGVKPLYYHCTGEEIYFASEIKTILTMTGKKFALNDQAVAAFLLQSLSDTSTSTMFEGIYRLPAGHVAEIDLDRDLLSLKIKRYWQVPYPSPQISSQTDIVDRIQYLFMDAIRLRLRSDVRVGVLLSGGVDSSAIACAVNFMTGQTKGDINLLSAVSDDHRFDESKFINKVSRYLNRIVHEVSLHADPQKMFSLLKTTSWFNDEPVTGFSTILHYLLMEKAKELDITVLLSGQGADELLCGYKKYLGFYVLFLLRQGHYVGALNILRQFYHRGTVIKQFDIREAKRYLSSLLKPLEIDIRGERLMNYSPVFMGLAAGADISQRQILDLECFSVPVLTHYEDRMSMAWAREIRLPFLDYRLMELLIPLNTEYKLNHGWTKYIFRQAMKEMMPPEVVWRKDKEGFVNPQSEWLRLDLKDDVMDIFSDDALIYQKGVVNKEKMVKKYKKYCSQSIGKWGISFDDVFNPLSLEVWMREYKDYLL